MRACVCVMLLLLLRVATLVFLCYSCLPLLLLPSVASLVFRCDYDVHARAGGQTGGRRVGGGWLGGQTGGQVGARSNDNTFFSFPTPSPYSIAPKDEVTP